MTLPYGVDRFEPSKGFRRSYAKLPTRERDRVKAALGRASHDLGDPLLHRHDLKGQLAGITSLSVGGDLRILCMIRSDGDKIIAVLVDVGTHSQLYG